MNNELRCEWVLAQLKRNINTAIALDTGEYESVNKTYMRVLQLIAEFEADSVLGTEEMMEDYIKQVTEGGEHDG